MKYILSALALILSCNALSANDAKQEKVIELINIMDVDSIIDNMYAQMDMVMQNTSTELEVKPSEKALFDKYYSKMISVMRQEVSWEKMQPQVIEIYKTNFNDKEIEDMIKFYRTDTGQAVLSKMPMLMQQSMQISQQMLQTSLPKIQEVMVEMEQELKTLRDKEDGTDGKKGIKEAKAEEQ